MKQALALVIIGLAAIVIVALFRTSTRPVVKKEGAASSVRSTMRLNSTAFNQNGVIPAKYTCDGANLSPPLSIDEVPPPAKSLALIAHDPDATKTDGWVHWTVWNLPPDTTELKEGQKPSGIEGVTDFGKPGYGGPCPPSGTHHYSFKVYALDQQLNLPATATRQQLQDAMAGHVIDQAELVGLYGRA